MTRTTALGGTVSTGEGLVFLAIILTHLAIRLVRVAIPFVRAVDAAGPTRPETIEMNLARTLREAAARDAARESLCNSCVFAHVVRGHKRGEEVIACGYVFPPRDMLFAVRECTDHKPKRESSGAEIADEGTVNLPPLEAPATRLRAVVAARSAGGT